MIPEDGDADDMDLSPVEVETLIALLDRGDDVPTNLADATGRHSKSVGRKLKDLENKGLVASKGAGVYTLTSEGVLLAHALRRERD